MKQVFAFLLLLTSVLAENPSQNAHCQSRFLSNTVSPARLTTDVSSLARGIASKIGQNHNISTISRELLSDHRDVLAVILVTKQDSALALNISGRLKIFPNRTVETDIFWRSFNLTDNGWGRPFKDCNFLRTWLYSYFFKSAGYGVGLLIGIDLNQCDRTLSEIYNGTHRCDLETTECVRHGGPTEQSGKYRCSCRRGFFYPNANLSWDGIPGEDIESGRIDSMGCQPCPAGCQICEQNGLCTVEKDVYLKTAILCIQLSCMGVTVILGLIVFKQRKTKAIASGMWTILETILLGIFILYSTVVVKFFEPSVVQCLLEPWTREVGFIICYGAVILKLYRHLIEFRTRKAHRWVVKDTDLLKYLLIMIMSVLGYMAAYTSITLNFMQENYSLLYLGRTVDGEVYKACKPLWWDYVTETGELIILIFGIHLSYASRNARTQFHERSFLCAAISIELAVSTLFYVARVLIFPGLHPDLVLIVYCIRTQLSQTLGLVLIFFPKFWYQQKQVRNLAQEYSCRIPVDAFKDVNAHGPLTGNNSDVDVGEVTLADMSPDDIRAELKRLYLQLEIFKSKTICRDNPHISKRRGGRKAQHRRFSLQNLHGKHKDKDRHKHQEEVTEAEPSRTPEDSVCSNEGPSAIYADLPSTTQSDHK
ncbi:probable G-protein coupled receptor 158 isoform X2 [Anoplophora glabripennis]|uniref:probable G-protein coupled receptor 158 isoform X2 n=1 Tax=Anoplophora glabripennis TaxID=217634 RepID=UPI000874C563|nr:probable G-protein coupled receptor 158 isoform X2 [Anoplophora glabripennis]